MAQDLPDDGGIGDQGDETQARAKGGAGEESARKDPAKQLGHCQRASRDRILTGRQLVEPLRTITEQWPGGDWALSIHAYCQSPSFRAPSKADERWLRRQFVQAVEAKRYSTAFDYALLALATTQGAMLQDPKFIGAFRTTELSSRGIRKIEALVARLTAELSGLVGAKVLARLDHCATFARLALHYRSELRLLTEKLFVFAGGMRALLHVLEDCFSERADTREREAVPALVPSVLEDLTKEDVSAAVSFLVAQIAKRGATRCRRFEECDLSQESIEQARALILNARHLQEIRELEVHVFHLGYTCVEVGEGVFEVRPPSEEFGKALSYGYIRQAARFGLASLGAQTDAESFASICTKFFLEFGDRLVEVTVDEPRRVRVLMPEPLLEVLGQKFFSPRAWFREELGGLRGNLDLLMTDFDTLGHFSVGETGLTLEKLLRMSRVLRFMAFIRNERLRRLKDEDWSIYARSTLLCVRRTELIRLLGTCGFPANEALQYLQLHELELRADRIIDLQYRNLIKMAGDTYWILPNVHSLSNSLRNVLASERLRLDSESVVDPVVEMLSDALRRRTGCISTNISYRAAGGHGDVDVACVVDGILFFFECKNTLLPCSAFEMRALHDQLSAAAEQLGRLRRAWDGRMLDERMTRELGAEVGETTPVVYGVVSGSRLLSGASVGGFAVRHVGEMCNLIETGKASIRSSEGEEVAIRLWSQAEFQVGDLISYFSEDSFYQCIWKSFTESATQTPVGHARVVTPSFGLDVVDCLRRYASAGYEVSNPGDGAPPTP